MVDALTTPRNIAPPHVRILVSEDEACVPEAWQFTEALAVICHSVDANTKKGEIRSDDSNAGRGADPLADCNSTSGFAADPHDRDTPPDKWRRLGEVLKPRIELILQEQERCQRKQGEG